MDASLRAWLSNASVMVGGGEDIVEVQVDAELTRVGRYIFGLHEAPELKDVRSHICSYFGIVCGPWLTTAAAIEACLVAAMSDDCPHRADFVRGIMGMSADDRSNLMVAIKGNMERFHSAEGSSGGPSEDDAATGEQAEAGAEARAFAEDASFDECDNSIATIPMNENGDVDFSVEEDGEEQQQAGWGEGLVEAHEGMAEEQEQEQEVERGFPEYKATTYKRARCEDADRGSSSSSNSGNNHAAFAGKCKACVEKDSSMQQLAADLDAALGHAHEVEIRLKSDIAMEKNKLVDAELQVIEREERLAGRDAELREARKRVNELETSLQVQMAATHELFRLQDEIDVLRTRADKADAAEAQIDRLRSRLDELLDVKQQLKTEAAAHSETYNRLIAAEQEAAALHKTRMQLEEYRSQYTESLLQVGELERRLQQRDDDLQRTRQDNQALGVTSQGSLIQTQHIMQELRETAEQLRHMERSNGIGEGMSELNPALMQELTKLRKDNAELGEQLSASSLESLARLEKDLADQRCMVSSLQQKLGDTKDALAAALQSVMQLSAEVCRLEQEQADGWREAGEASAMDCEEKSAARLARAWSEQHAHKRLFSAISLAVQGQRAASVELSHELTSTAVELASTQGQVSDLSSQKELLDAAHEGKLREVAGLEAALVSQLQHHEQIVAEASEAHAASLGREMDRCRELEADLGEEQQKRRKVERERKFFESEAKSNKNLLIISGGGGGSSGQEVEAALREIKAMQQQLDASNVEVQVLRAQIAAGGGGSDGASSSACLASSSSSAGGRGAPGASRPLRVKTGIDRDAVTNAPTATSFTSYFEQTGIVDKRLEQADRERRQLIATNLEESRDKMELQQKLLKSEKEIAALKRANTKLTLEKERLLSKAGAEDVDVDDKENAENSPARASRTCRRMDKV